MFKAFFKINKEIWQYRETIFAIAKKEFKNEYTNSALGIVWSLIKPFVMIVAYWFAFTYGLRSGAQEINGIQVPFVAWLIPGVFAWSFLSDTLIIGAMSIRGSAHLVKKVVFPISTLPAIKVQAQLLNHFIFLAISFVLLLILRINFTIYSVQILYYLFAAIMLSLAISRLTAALVVMSIDILHFIQTSMQLLFWFTPVIWPVSKLAGKSPVLVNLFKLNPFFYIVEGYRTSLFGNTWFWQQPVYMAYFWILTGLIFLFGSYYYEKNRPEFADVL